MRAAFALTLLLGAADATKLGQSKMAPALRLRGGGLDVDAKLVMTLSSAAAVATGLGIYAGQESLVKLLWLNMVDLPMDKMYGIAVLGWGIGKINAVQGGEDSAKNMAKINMIPMALFVHHVFTSQGLVNSLVPAVFLAAYAYVGVLS